VKTNLWTGFGVAADAEAGLAPLGIVVAIEPPSGLEGGFFVLTPRRGRFM
jgi:hypothetical protein